MIVDLNPEIYKGVCGDYPETPVVGVGVIREGKALGFCGYIVVDGINFVVCKISEGMKNRDVITAWNTFRSIMFDDEDYYAIIDEDEPTAPDFLLHFGFLHLKDDTYIYGEKRCLS